MPRHKRALLWLLTHTLSRKVNYEEPPADNGSSIVSGRDFLFPQNDNLPAFYIRTVYIVARVIVSVSI